MADRIDLAITEYNRAIDDYTSLGRWAWGLAITFGTGVLFNSGEKEIISNLGRVSQSILLVVLALAVLVFFVWHAWRRVKLGRESLNSVEMNADPRVVWVLGGGVHDHTGLWILMLRLMPTLVVLYVYWRMIDDVVCKAQYANEWWGRLLGISLCHWLPS